LDERRWPIYLPGSGTDAGNTMLVRGRGQDRFAESFL
jgi:hypothetical protein